MGIEFERITVRGAVQSKTGIDIAEFLQDPVGLARAAREVGVRISDRSTTFDDVFNQLFLAKVEPTLGFERPTFLFDYPGSMAALSRLKPSDDRWAERFELYIGGLELANGFSELVDAGEQRRRLVEEQAQRRAEGRTVYPLDEVFLEAVGRMPPSGGVALGIDRLLMLLLGKRELADVLLFPARDFLTPPPAGDVPQR
jgi:lysyl-tRNA synthetase class 2